MGSDSDTPLAAPTTPDRLETIQEPPNSQPAGRISVFLCGRGAKADLGDLVAVGRFRRFLELAGPAGAAHFPAELLDELVDDRPDAPTWREWIGAS